MAFATLYQSYLDLEDSLQFELGEISFENSAEEELQFFLLLFPPGRSLKPILSPPMLVLPMFYKDNPKVTVYI